MNQQTPAAASVAPTWNHTLLALLRDVAASGHADIDPRLSYVDVQIDVDTWRRISGMFPAKQTQGARDV